MAMAALASEVVFVLVALRHAGKARSQPDQFADHLGTVANDRLNGDPIAQPGARLQRVLHVRLEGVIHAPSLAIPPCA